MSGLSMSRRRLTCSCSFDFDVENPPSDGNVNNTVRHLTPHQILYQAAINGDWKTAQKVLDGRLHHARDTITRRGNTVLHIAAMAKQTSFVTKLVRKLDRSDLEVKNEDGCTAFCCAVLSGVVENARVMREKNAQLATIRAYDDLTPIHQAALMGHKEMVSYLYTVTPLEELLDEERIEILGATIRNDMYDVALNIINNDRRFALAKLDENQSLLHLLARKRIARTCGMQEGICRRFLGSTCAVFSTRLWNRIQQKSLAKKKAYQLFEEIWTEYLNAEEDDLMNMIKQTEILHYAAKHGNAEFLAMILRKKPDLLWELNTERHTIFHVAVIHRQKEVFDLIYHKEHFRDLITFQIDKGDNNILHLTAKLGWPSRSSEESTNGANPQQPAGGGECSKKVEKIMPQSFLKVSGAALQLQRELLWFKEVGNIVPRYFLKMRNEEGKTPKEIFSEEHRELMKEGENWMRGTANWCMIAATLIATMVFAAAFTVPGGNNSDKGTPVFIKRSSFTVFTISDSVAMFSSIVTIIMFLSILISRYTEDDFRVSLPLKLLVGLTSLFVSIVAMLVAFAVAFFLIYDKAWQPKLIAAFAGVPFLLFLCLNFKLWYDTSKSIMLSLILNFKGVMLDD